MHADHFPHLTVPGAAPAPPVPANRFVKRGAYMLCLSCGFTSMYCRCASQPTADAGSQDAAAGESLAKRIKDCGR